MTRDASRFNLKLSHLREHALQIRRVECGRLLSPLDVLAVFNIVVVVVAFDVGRRVLGRIVAQHDVALLAGKGDVQFYDFIRISSFVYVRLARLSGNTYFMSRFILMQLEVSRYGNPVMLSLR